jgi:hypothetical protein
VYHGSPRSFEEMDPDKAGEGSTLGKGFSFSKDPKDANLAPEPLCGSEQFVKEMRPS